MGHPLQSFVLRDGFPPVRFHQHIDHGPATNGTGPYDPLTAWIGDPNDPDIQPAFGLIIDDEDCGDPTLVIWRPDGEAILSIHFGKLLEFAADPEGFEQEFWEDVMQQVHP